eukprot:GDKK01038472.1.p1 GENE.GDKK01038472.1~~GDKK01038472.1.p1  ORF type:complete len:817 (+),score=233.14 GDKK01038472.1:31-2451(+)
MSSRDFFLSHYLNHGSNRIKFTMTVIRAATQQVFVVVVQGTADERHLMFLISRDFDLLKNGHQCIEAYCHFTSARIKGQPCFTLNLVEILNSYPVPPPDIKETPELYDYDEWKTLRSNYLASREEQQQQYSAHPNSNPPPSHHGGYNPTPQTGTFGASSSSRQQGGGFQQQYNNQSSPNRQSVASSSSGFRGGAQNGGPVSYTSGGAVLSIRQIAPHQQKWVIIARVASKSDMRSYKNAKGDGQFFKATFIDGEGCDIQGSFFNKTATIFYPQLEVGKVYRISNAKVQDAKPQFNSAGSPYELMFSESSEIAPVRDDTVSSNSRPIPKQVYKNIPIASLRSVTPNSYVDIVALVVSVSPISSVLIKSSQTQSSKRTLLLRDASDATVELTLWGEKCTIPIANEDGSLLPPPPAQPMHTILVKSVRVGDYGGVSLSTVQSSSVEFDSPPASVNLDAFFATLFKYATSEQIQKEPQSLTQSSGGASGAGGSAGGKLQMRTLEMLSRDVDETKMYGVVANIVQVPSRLLDRPPFYPGCWNCKKKVVESVNGWRCENCQTETPTPNRRWILKLKIRDATQNVTIDLYHDVACMLFEGHTADSLVGEQESQLITQEAAERMEQIIRNFHFKEYMFKLRTKMKTYEGNTRAEHACFAVEPVNYTQLGSHKVDLILEAIKNLELNSFPFTDYYAQMGAGAEELKDETAYGNNNNNNRNNNNYNDYNHNNANAYQQPQQHQSFNRQQQFGEEMMTNFSSSNKNFPQQQSHDRFSSPYQQNPYGNGYQQPNNQQHTANRNQMQQGRSEQYDQDWM